MVKNMSANAGDTGDTGSIPGSGRYPGGGNGNPLQPGKFHGQKSLVDHRESDVTEHACTLQSQSS